MGPSASGSGSGLLSGSLGALSEYPVVNETADCTAYGCAYPTTGHYNKGIEGAKLKAKCSGNRGTGVPAGNAPYLRGRVKEIPERSSDGAVGKFSATSDSCQTTQN